MWGSVYCPKQLYTKHSAISVRHHCLTKPAVLSGSSLEKVGYASRTGIGHTCIRVLLLTLLCVLQIPNFDKLAIISFMAAVMSLGYSTIAIGISIKNGGSSDPTISVCQLARF